MKIFHITLAALALAAALPDEAAARRYLTIGAGGVTGIYYPAAGAIAKIVNEKSDENGIRATVESTGGSTYNVNSMSVGELDMGLVQSDVAHRAYHGAGEYKGRKVENLRSLFSLHEEPFHIVARKDAGIETLAGLKGKRVNIGNPGSGQRSSAAALFSVAPLGLGDISAQNLNATEAPNYLRDGRIDAYCYTVGVGSANIMDVASSASITLVPVDGATLEALTAGRPYYVRTRIPGGVYPGVAEPVETFAVRATLLATTALPGDVVYNVVKAVFENFDKFRKTHSALGGLEPQKMLEGLSAPLHPGAEKYYRERGWLK
ncbi:MAG: TAXI family TRAP transporter solute-binding subunit [Candidatus Nitrospinota bacterium M3_3B_026]